MFDPTTYTGVHTWLSIIAILAGIPVVGGLLRGQALPGWTALFLATAVATSATGFGFPFGGLLPSHIVGGVALAVLAVAMIARYVQRLAGAWRGIYALAAVASLYFLVFVAIAQSFQKIPALQSPEPGTPFAVSQLVALALFAALAFAAFRGFRPAPAR